MRFFIPIILLTFVSCQSNQEEKNSQDTVQTQPRISADTTNKVDTLIISERIDGPANIRDSINGNLLFTLHDNVEVTATKPIGNWLQVGLFVDLSQEQLDSLLIRKGDKILLNSKEVGMAVEDIHLNGAMEGSDGHQGELTGFTAVSNIRPNTIMENVLVEIINGSPGTVTEKSLGKFLKEFGFTTFNGLLPGFKAYEIDENWIDDPSPMLRLWILFDGEQLYGIFHSRPLQVNKSSTVKVNRGFYYTSFSEYGKRNKELVDAFNSFIEQVD